MQDDLPLSRKGRMISSIDERSRARSLTASLRFFLSKRLRQLLWMRWERSCLYAAWEPISGNLSMMSTFFQVLLYM